MVTNFYDSSPENVETQHIRLKPARVIIDEHIPYIVVWAEDALSFAHTVPTSLFALQLLVPDEHVHAASSAVAKRLPYAQIREPTQEWLEHKFIDRGQPTCFPNSVHLRLTERQHEDPEDIYIHPQSFFSLNVRNYNLSTSLVPPLPSSNSQIRFPTRTAVLDSLIDTMLDPPIGFRHWKLTQSIEVYIGYLISIS
jgi:hypothetical protein